MLWLHLLSYYYLQINLGEFPIALPFNAERCQVNAIEQGDDAYEAILE
jgi:hypothetical protein